MGLNAETGVGIAPDTLGVRMTLELNMLDAVGESLLQVTNAERTRAVSMAQQETVALAQILKVCAQRCFFFCSFLPIWQVFIFIEASLICLVPTSLDLHIQ